MQPYQYQQPTQQNWPPVPMQPPRSTRPKWLIPAIIGGPILFIIFACVACGIIGSFIPKPPDQPSTHTVIASPTATQQPTNVTQALPTPTPTLKPQPTTGGNMFPSTHGYPHIGGLLSDFVGMYGQPDSPNSQPYQFSDSANQVMLGVRTSGPNTTQVIIIQLGTSDKASGTAFCTRYFPHDARRIGGSSASTLYSSSVGQFSVSVNDRGDCTANMAQS